MKEFTDLTLCEMYSDWVDVHVRASLVDGELTFSGNDLGPCVEQVWGDLDYEYWYSFDKENTRKLLAAIGGEEDPEAALLRKFSGESGCQKLENFCDRKGIEYGFSSYV